MGAPAVVQHARVRCAGPAALAALMHARTCAQELTSNQQRGVGGALRGGDLADPEHAPPPPEVCGARQAWA